MLPDTIHQYLTLFLQKEFPEIKERLTSTPVSGGSINEAFRINAWPRKFFLKYNHAGKFPGMFEKEAAGLKLLKSAGEIDIPQVLLTGDAGGYSFLLLEYVESAREQPDFWEDFGKRLAALHCHKSGRFGLDHDNYMGSLFQHNNFHDNWVEFFVQERLERQIRLARESGRVTRPDVGAMERLYHKLGEIFPETKPSLIHGDLWSGNFMVNNQGMPCLIDPATYYGHPEADIAMTRLFGGFSERFYEAYNAHTPLEKGWQQRLDYYNLYPLLVHVNLFGEGYLGSVQQILRKF